MLQQYFHRLSKNCGKLKLGENELSIIDVTDDEFVVQDVYGRQAPQRIKRTDAKINGVELYSAFS
jgi:hypothetical protein